MSRLTKPVRRSQLYNTLCQAVASPRFDRPRSSVASHDGSKLLVPLRVLLAEDNPINRKVATGMVERLGCRIDVAENGQEAMEMLASTRYDIIFLDVQMPVMDGLAATVAIRDGEKGTDRHIPIIAMTAHVMMGDREKCLVAGMDDYLRKPLRPGPLGEMLLTWGNEKKSPAEQPKAGSVAEGRAFDCEALRETCGTNPDAIRDLLELMLVTVCAQLRRLDAAVASLDGDQVIWEAHTLQDGFLAVGAMGLVTTCQELMMLGARPDFTGIRQAHRLVHDQWVKFREAVTRHLETLPTSALVGVAANV